MRSDFDTYKHFYYRFVRSIVGRREFDLVIANWNTGQCEGTLATISDEALALLSFENGFDVWKDVYERSGGKIRPIPREEEYPKEWISNKETKYTTRRDAKGAPVDTKDKSWTAEGILRFNELLAVVARDRKKNPYFIEKFIEWKKTDGMGMGDWNKGTREEENFPTAHHTLFHNPDNLNELSFTPVRKDQKNGEREEQEDSDEESDEDEDSGSDTDLEQERNRSNGRRRLYQI